MGFFDNIKGFFGKNDRKNIEEDFNFGFIGYGKDANGNEFLTVPEDNNFRLFKMNDGNVKISMCTDNYEYCIVAKNLSLEEDYVNGQPVGFLSFKKGTKELNGTIYVMELGDSLEDNIYKDEINVKIKNWKNDLGRMVQLVYTMDEDSIEYLPLKRKVNYDIEAFKNDLGLDVSDMNIYEEIEDLTGKKHEEYNKLDKNNVGINHMHIYPGVNENYLEKYNLNLNCVNPKSEDLKLLISGINFLNMDMGDIKYRVKYEDISSEYCNVPNGISIEHYEKSGHFFYAGEKLTKEVNKSINKNLNIVLHSLSKENQWDKCVDKLKDVVAVTALANAVNQHYLNNYGIEFLTNTFIENLNNKLSVSNGIDKENSRIIATLDVQLLDKKLKDIKQQLINNFFSNDVMKEQFLKWHKGENQDFPKKFKLEMPEQQKLINEYNNIIKDINKVYDKQLSIQKDNFNRIRNNISSRYIRKNDKDNKREELDR